MQIDTSAWTDTTAVNFNKSDLLQATAADTQDVTVSGVTLADSTTEVDGGKDVSFTGTGDVTIGATTVNDGSITVTHTNKDTAATTDDKIGVNGGTTVTITDTADQKNDGTTAAITVGQGATATDFASGAVTVTQNLNSDGSVGDLTGGNITIDGGATVDVTVNATSNAAKAANDDDIVIGTVSVTGQADTTSITITQNKSITNNTQEAEGGSVESTTATFKELKQGDSITLSVNADDTVDAGELTFTAVKDLTAEEVAAAFANLTSADTQSATGVTANGIYTNSLVGWTSAAADGASVTFTTTDTTINANKTNLQVVVTDNGGGSAALADEVITEATAVTTAYDKSSNTVTYGVVDLDDAAGDVTTVAIDGYKTGSDLESFDGLTDLSLANGDDGADITIDTDKTTLNLTLDGIDSDYNTNNGKDIATIADAAVVNLDDGSATLETLNITASGSDSNINLTASKVTTLNVNGDALLDLSQDELKTGASALETVTVTGDAGLKLHADESATLISVDASGTTGNVTLSIDTDTADGQTPTVANAYKGGSGSDTITVVTATTVESEMTLGAGDDTLTLDATNTAFNAAVDAGAGDNDIISMNFATADNFDANSTFATNATNFEKIKINNSYTDGNANSSATLALDVSKLGYNYVITSGSLVDADAPNTESDILSLTEMTSGDTVELTATGMVQATLADATGDDVMNIVTTITGDADNTISNEDTDFGKFTVADVETVNITANDTDLDEDKDGTASETNEVDTATLALAATDATKIVIDGSSNLTLDTSANTKVTEIDGSAMTGALTVTAAGGVASTIKGGSANDALTGSTGGSAGTTNATGTTLTYHNTGVQDGANETWTASFTNDMAETDVLTVGGLTLTLAADDDGGDTVTITAANTAAAFASLSAEATTGNTPTLTGNNTTTTTQTSFYTDSLSAEYNTGDVHDTVKVTFTAIAEGDATDITKADSGATTVALTTSAAVAHKSTVDVTDAFSGVSDLDTGDKISIDIDIDGDKVGGAAATTVSYTAVDTISIDDAMAALLVQIELDTTNIDAASSYTTGTDLLTIQDKIAGEHGVTLSNFTVTDASNGAATTDTLYGNAGNDTLTGGDLTKLYGGDGADTFVMNTSSNVNKYTTIMDLESGDAIDFGTGQTFVSAAQTLDDTAVFQDYANATVKYLDDNSENVGWFQFESNTYIIQSGSDATDDFVAGVDSIIKISGLVDLGTDASYNATSSTLELA